MLNFTGSLNPACYPLTIAYRLEDGKKDRAEMRLDYVYYTTARGM